MKKIKNFKWKLLSLLTVFSMAFATLGVVLFRRLAVAENEIETDALFTSNVDMNVEYGAQDDYGNTGVQLTLNNMLSTKKPVVQYNSYIDKNDIGSALLRFSTLPARMNVQEFAGVVVTATDAVDTTQQLSFAIIQQTSGWWPNQVSSWVAFTDELSAVKKEAYQGSLVMQLDGTYQNAIALNAFLSSTNGLYTGRYMDTGSCISRDGTGAKDTNDDDNIEEYKGLFSRGHEKTKTNSIRLAFDGTDAWINKSVIASLKETDFLSVSSAGLHGTKFENRYTQDYVDNLFSSGYCTLKMTFIEPLTDTASIHITQIGEKLFLSESDAEYSKPYFLTDKEKEAVCGFGYELPRYEVKSVRGGDLTENTVCEVFDETGNAVQITSGKITFEKAGKYVMRLSVEDNGVLHTHELPITCFAEMPTTFFQIEDDFQETYYTGESIILKKFRALSEVNCKNSGYLDAYAVLQMDGETLLSCKAEETVEYTLGKAGYYTLHYVAQNAYGVYEIESYGFTVDKGLFFTDYKAPLAFRKGQLNTLSDFSIVNYVNDTAESELYRAIYIDDKQIYLAQGDRVISGALTVSEFSQDSVNVVYKAGFSENEWLCEKRFTVPIIETKYIEDWFLSYDEDGRMSEIGTFQDDAEKMIFNAKKDGSLTFANYVGTADFSVQFAVGAEKKAFNSLTMILQDPSNLSKSVEVELRYLNETQSLLFVNGKASGTTNGSLVDATKGFLWNLSTDGKSLREIDGTLVTEFTCWSDATAFDGFKDGGLILTFAFDGIAEEKIVPFHLFSISNQTLFTSYILGEKAPFIDINAPIIYTHTAFENVEKSFGYTFAITSASAYDILQTNVEMQLRVLAPNNEYVLTTSDLSVKNFVKLDAFGVWMIVITAEDVRTGAVSERRIVVTVKDKIAPNIEISGKIYTEYKLDKKYTFAQGTATDNVTETVDVLLIVVWENGYREVAKNFEYTFKVAGKYRLMYYAIDESYNASKIVYEVNAK